MHRRAPDPAKSATGRNHHVHATTFGSTTAGQNLRSLVASDAGVTTSTMLRNPNARTNGHGRGAALPGAMTVVWSATWFRVGIRCSRSAHHRWLQATELIEGRNLGSDDIGIHLADRGGDFGGD